MEIVERTRICPSPDSTPPAPFAMIPLSFFDIPWLLCRPMQRLFFYDQPKCTLLHFTETTLPTLKQSFAVSLGRYYPLAGGLACPSEPVKPYIFCSEGDAVAFIAAMSDANFDQITSDRPQAATLLHPLLPPLPPHVVKDGVSVAPLFAVQVTLFPNAGICIGVQFIHVAADGMAFNNFMKTWGSICRAELHGDASCIVMKSLPVLDRTIIKDPNCIETALLKDWWKVVSTSDGNIASPSPSLKVEKLRASFTLTRAQVDHIKSLIIKQTDEILHISTFVVTCAYVWRCLIKAKEIGDAKALYPDAYPFCFVADCRHRLGYLIPETYLGNCLDICFVIVKRRELLGPHGTVSAAKAIGAKVKELETEGCQLGRAERWLSDWQAMSGSGCLVVVAGSPRLRVYDTDFGWGRPMRSRVVHIDGGDQSISLSESSDGKGGVEIGLALGRAAMDAFSSMFEQGLDSCSD